MPETVPTSKGIELLCRLFSHRFIHDRVPPIDALSLVPDHCHRGGAGHPSSLEVSNSRAPQVMGDAARTASVTAGGVPPLDEALDRLAVAVKHPRYDPPQTSQTVRFVSLALQQRPQIVREGKHPGLGVLRRARLEADLLSCPVDVRPLEVA